VSNSWEASHTNEKSRVCAIDERIGGLTRLPQLAQPLLHFDLPAEIEHLRREESWQWGTGRSSKTLVKQPDFRIVLVAMKSNTEMKEHRAEGRISIQTIAGHLRLKLPDSIVDLPAGHLLAVDRCLTHDVEALVESSFLLTISWPPDATA